MPRRPTIPATKDGDTSTCIAIPNRIYRPLAEKAVATKDTVKAIILRALETHVKHDG